MDMVNPVDKNRPVDYIIDLLNFSLVLVDSSVCTVD